MTGEGFPLTHETVVRYLADRGLLDGEGAVATRLSGGVSNVVLAVSSGHQRLVVKQSLGRLDVAEQWLATRRRTVTEAAALRLASTLTPAHVPEVIDLDTDALVLVIPAAPASWQVLKDDLVEGRIDLDVFTGLADVLCTWHNRTASPSEQRDRCDDPEAFRQLRTDPFHRTVASRHPELAERILLCVDELESSRMCLVHGDFSPKNVLVGPDGFWVIDFEVAHIGAPVFDVAFLLTHLLLKAVFRPAHRAAYEAAGQLFWQRYEQGIEASLRCSTSSLVAHLGCLLLARVDGRSPASYLSADDRRQVRRLGESLLQRPALDLDDVYDRLTEVTRAG